MVPSTPPDSQESSTAAQALVSLSVGKPAVITPAPDSSPLTSIPSERTDIEDDTDKNGEERGVDDGEDEDEDEEEDEDDDDEGSDKSGSRDSRTLATTQRWSARNSRNAQAQPTTQPSLESRGPTFASASSSPAAAKSVSSLLKLSGAPKRLSDTLFDQQPAQKKRLVTYSKDGPKRLQYAPKNNPPKAAKPSRKSDVFEVPETPQKKQGERVANPLQTQKTRNHSNTGSTINEELLSCLQSTGESFMSQEQWGSFDVLIRHLDSTVLYERGAVKVSLDFPE